MSIKMQFTKLTEIELPGAFDAHVHLRDGAMSQLVTPTIRKGGVNQVYVMVSNLASFSWYIYIYIFLQDISISHKLQPSLLPSSSFPSSCHGSRTSSHPSRQCSNVSHTGTVSAPSNQM
jgi:hypothetical protein